jgi:glutamine amidotransferase
MIGIVNYGAGNLKSVCKAFSFLGADFRIVGNAGDLSGIKSMLLPGVGSFGTAVNNLHLSGLFQPISEWLRQDRKFLGICLGLQLLLEESEESPGARGFGIFKGICKKLPVSGDLKVPHIGWNRLSLVKENNVTQGTPNYSYFYFVHSYYADLESDDFVIARCEHSISFPAAVLMGNITAIQCHPEKSGEAGLKLLKNWVASC